MILRLIFLVLTLAVFTGSVYAQAFSCILSELDEVLTSTCLNGHPDPNGTPLPDGTTVFILWDNDSNGPDDDDPSPPYCPGCGPECSATDVTMTSFSMNGESIGLPGGFFVFDTFGSCFALPTPARYYMRICLANMRLESPVQVMTSGPNEWDPGPWNCSLVPCTGCQAPLTPQNVIASDDNCGAITINWTYPDTVSNVGLFRLFRDSNPLTTIVRTGATQYSYTDSTAPAGFSGVYQIDARRICTDPPPADTVYSSRASDAGNRPNAPPVPTNVLASDNLCDSVVVSFQYTTNLGVDSFIVKRNGVRVGAIQAVGVPGARSFRHTGAPAGVAAYTVVGRNASCGEGTASLPDNGTNLDLIAATNVQASEEFADSVVVTWTDITGETGYQVWRAAQDGSGASQIGTVGSNVVRFRDPVCSPGLIRQYWVIATGGACGPGDPSAHDFGTCGAATPPVPQNVQASDGTNCDNVVITWNDVTNEDGYRVYRDGVMIGSTAANVVTLTDNTAVSGTVYSYTVSAFNADGESNQSIPNTGFRLGIPGQVTGVAATDTSCFGVTVTWTDMANESGYTISRNGTQIGQVAANVVTFFDDQAASGTYTYGVAATNACGTGSAGEDQGTRLPGAPATPTNLVASDNQCGLTHLTWTDVPTETSYNVVRADSSGANPTTIGSTAVNVTTFDDLTGSLGVIYRYWVVAVNTCGSSEPSVFNNGVRFGTPAAPTGVTASDGTVCDSVFINFTFTEFGVDSFIVRRNAVRIGALPVGGAPGQRTFHYGGADASTIAAYSVIAKNNLCGEGAASTADNGNANSRPGQVLNVLATDNDCQRVTVTWAALTNVDSFQVRRDGTRIGATVGNVTTFSDFSASVGVTYAYTVVAYNVCGAGNVSAPDNGTRISGALPPVTGVTATNNICDNVLVTWNDIAGEDSFQVRRDGARIGVRPANSTTFTDNTAALGLTYSYTIVAYNNCGEGQVSAGATGGLAPRPAAPTGFVINAGCPTLELVWQLSSGATSYTITRDGVQIGQVTHPTNNFVDDPGDNASHSYTVTANNACGAGQPTAPVSGQRQGNTPPPTDLAANEDVAGIVVLTWTPTPGTDATIIYRNGAVLDTVDDEVTEYIDAPPAGLNTYAVSAYSLDCGESVLSAEVTVNITHPVIFFQPFPTSSMPAGWTVQHLGTTTMPWAIVNEGGGDFAPHVGLQGTAASALEYLISPVLDFTGTSDITISFISSMRNNPGAFGYLQASIDTGQTWQNLLTIIGNDTMLASRHLSVTFNNSPWVQFRWKFTGSASQPAEWAIDDVRIAGAVETPPAPMTIGGFGVTDNSNGIISLQWDPARSIFFSQYELLYGMTEDLSDAIILTRDSFLDLGEIGLNGFGIENLEPNTPFHFAIRVRDIYGAVSELSEIASGSALPEQNGPLLHNPNSGQGENWWNLTDVEVSVSIEDQSELDLTSLELRVDVDGNGEYDETETWQPAQILGEDNEGVYTIAALFTGEGAAQRYELRIRDEWGTYGYSGTENAEGAFDDWNVNIDLTAPEPVENFGPSSWTSTETVQLVWSPSSDLSASRYELFYATHPNITEEDVRWDATNDPGLADPEQYYTNITELDPATTYYFRMRAIDAAGHLGEWSDEISVTTQGEVTAQSISELTIHAVAGLNGPALELRWNPVSTDVNGNPIAISGYRIYRADGFDTEMSMAVQIGESTSESFRIEDIHDLPANSCFIVTAVVGSGSEGPSRIVLPGR